MPDAAHPQPPLRPDYSLLPPRRVQVRLDDPTLRAILGLKPDESIHAIQYHAKTGAVDVVIDSPRLRPVGYFMYVADQKEPVYQTALDCEPPYVKLPLSDHYEPQDDKPYPSVITFPTPGGPSVAVPLVRTDGVLAPNDPDGTIMGLLKDDEQETVRQICKRYSLVQE